MTVIWHETTDDEVNPPDGMAVASATVRRRSWESHSGHRRVELTVYLGVDVLSAVVIRWDCQVWEYGEPMDRMTSGTRLYWSAATNSPRLAIDAITPAAVKFYAVWGELLSATANQQQV